MKPLADCRLYTFIDAAYLNNRDPADLARQLIDGGADLIQLRAKNWPEERIRKTAETLHPITHAAGVRLVINDHLAIATQVAADLCHLGQEDFFDETGNNPQPSNLKPQLGLSTHSPAQAERAMKTDAAYLAVGPVYPTPTKPGRPAVTREYVQWAVAHIDRPRFAIGGITLENIGDVLAAGARRICAVSSILNSPDIPRACQQFHQHLASVPLKQKS